MLSFWLVNPAEDLYFKYLLAVVLEKILSLVIAVICIKRSEKMFSFCKNQIIAWFCCCPHTNRGINADSITQWQETYVTDSLDQNSNEDNPEVLVSGNTGNEFALHRIS